LQDNDLDVMPKRVEKLHELVVENPSSSTHDPNQLAGRPIEFDAGSDGPVNAIEKTSWRHTIKNQPSSRTA
jgi:hypothetical protein